MRDFKSNEEFGYASVRENFLSRHMTKESQWGLGIMQQRLKIAMDVWRKEGDDASSWVLGFSSGPSAKLPVNLTILQKELKSMVTT